MKIIGVIGDVRTGALDLPPMPQFYTPASQDAPSRMFIIVRTTIDSLRTLPAAVSIVHQLDPEQPIDRMETMQSHVSETMGLPRLQASLITFFAIAALFLAAVGIYGVVAHATLQRTRELAIRVALGADRVGILKAVRFGELPAVLLGVVLGLFGAHGLTRFLAGALYEVQPNDPLITVAAAILLSCVGLAACMIPARRATRLEPMVALRCE